MTTKSMKDLIDQKEHYRSKVLERAKTTTKKVGYHFNCPDGVVSAALLKHVFPSLNLQFIPIDYPMLKDKEVMESFTLTDWFAIVDLSPFNSKEIDYFFDHHISNVGKKINATEHVFDPKAPSAAALIALYFSDKVSNYMKELADITEITDTASYKTPAPLALKENFEENDWDDKIWFLQDVCKSTYTIEEHDQLIEILSINGLKGLWKEEILERVKAVRQSRKDAFDRAEEIDIKDFIIIIDSPLHYNTAFIASEVMKKGATGVAYITVYPDEVKISLRLSRSLKPQTVEKYRVDLLAKKMDGGGHKGASGAEMESLEPSLEEIIEWTKEKVLETEIVDLRQK
ncbi:MAG: hypothetical protein GOP50_03505 [Candidatus Heimdallarchaeota archaeon]|nr:hypothetical protein [Candidatus Heimdallarchaeota archaeon]